MGLILTIIKFAGDVGKSIILISCFCGTVTAPLFWGEIMKCTWYDIFIGHIDVFYVKINRWINGMVKFKKITSLTFKAVCAAIKFIHNVGYMFNSALVSAWTLIKRWFFT